MKHFPSSCIFQRLSNDTKYASIGLAIWKISMWLQNKPNKQIPCLIYRWYFQINEKIEKSKVLAIGYKYKYRLVIVVLGYFFLNNHSRIFAPKTKTKKTKKNNYVVFCSKIWNALSWKNRLFWVICILQHWQFAYTMYCT